MTDSLAVIVQDMRRCTAAARDRGTSLQRALVTSWADRIAAMEAGAGGDGLLPDALVPHAKEWYRLCERRFAVDRITISGPLAEAIVTALAAAPKASEAVDDDAHWIAMHERTAHEYAQADTSQADPAPPVAGEVAPAGAVAWKFWIDDPTSCFNPHWSGWSSDDGFKAACLGLGYRGEYATPDADHARMVAEKDAEIASVREALRVMCEVVRAELPKRDGLAAQEGAG